MKALVDDCIEAESPALRPSAYEVFVRLSTRRAPVATCAAAAQSKVTPAWQTWCAHACVAAGAYGRVCYFANRRALGVFSRPPCHRRSCLIMGQVP